MTDIDWGKLAEPFPPTEVKERQGPRQHDGQCQKRGSVCQLQHRMLSYVDARAVAQRLDDVVTPAGWDFSVELQAGDVVKGKLVVAGIVREDVGYPNSDDDAEPYKSAVSDALKRCAVLFGIGRHLYDDNKNGHRPAQNGSGRPQAARPPLRAVSAPASVPDDPYGDDLEAGLLPAGGTNPAVCAEHGEPWRGTPGDLYHKKAEGGYCRHPENVQKARVAR